MALKTKLKKLAFPTPIWYTVGMAKPKKPAPIPVVETKPTVADLSNQLSSMLNKSAVEGIEDVPVPAKEVTKTATFTGHLIAFDGLCVIPIKGYKATEEDGVTPKTTLCGTKLKQESMKCPKCNIGVDKGGIVKAVETTKNVFVLLSDDEMAKMKPAMGDKTLKLTGFVDPIEVN